MQKHIHVHLYSGAAKTAPVKDLKHKDCSCSSEAGIVDEKEGFKKLESELSHEKGVTNPAALAAAIGRRKYGAARMAAKAAAGRK